MKIKQATQDDVAQLAGVTRATVSYVLNGRAAALKITPAVTKRVEEAARKLRYVPNLAARSLAAGRSRQIGLLLPGPDYIRYQYWGSIAAGVERAALQAGYDVLLLASHEDLFQTAENYLLQNRVDIIIALGGSPESLLSRLPVPPIIIGGATASEKLPLVYASVEAAVAAMLDHLDAQGLKRVSWLGPISALHPGSQDRLQAVRAGCHDRGMTLKVAEMAAAARDMQLGEEAAIQHWHSLIVTGAEPALDGAQVVICWNDLIALAVYQWMRGRNLEPGRDLAVVGFDDHFAQTALPSLSSVSFESESVGGEAVKLALEVLSQERGKSPFRKIAVPARFIPRRSTGGA